MKFDDLHWYYQKRVMLTIVISCSSKGVSIGHNWRSRSSMASSRSSWRLDLVAQLQLFRECLPAHENDALASALLPADALADFKLLRNGDGALRSAADSHLDRYKRWKLGDAKIEELTSVRTDAGADEEVGPSAPVSEALVAVRGRVGDLSFFARGKRGVLFAATLRSSGASVVVKFAGDPRASTSSTAAGCWVETEAKWIRIMNRVGIGAQLESFGTGWLICERLEGQNIVEFLSTTATPATARWVLKEILLQCFTMDMMGINKEEMTHPTRHIIIHCGRGIGSSGSARWRCSFIDFEKCSHTKKPKNVTQICQFLTSPRMTSLFQAKGATWDVHALRQRTKRYKLRVSSEAFDELLRIFGL